MDGLDLLAQPAYFAASCLLLGLAVGSFLNVVIHRLPKMMERDWQAQCAELANAPGPVLAPLSLSRPRSSCPKCGHRISALENIPIVSWLALRGRCSACKAAISPRYPLVEALTALLSAYAGWHFGFTLAAAPLSAAFASVAYSRAVLMWDGGLNPPGTMRICESSSRFLTVVME